jgi:PKHD-type hydroxylase
MMVRVPAVLSKYHIREVRAIMVSAQWIDGNATAGFQSALAKNNLQIPEASAESRQLGDMVLDGLARSPLFISAALPLKTFPPLFNCYRGGQEFGTHIDNAIRPIKGTPHRVRTDLSATLFLCEPDEYDGGELVVEDTYGSHRAKLPAGDLILYPASSLHQVTPVTRGARLASFFWIQSMVRDDGARALMFDLDNAIQRLAAEKTHKDPTVVQLTGVYHNLLRRWADT